MVCRSKATSTVPPSVHAWEALAAGYPWPEETLRKADRDFRIPSVASGL